MDAKEYLEGIMDATNAIKRKLGMLENLQEMRFRITQTLKADIVSGGGKGGGFSGASDSLLDLERELNEDVERYAKMICESKALLGKVKSRKYYDVLYKHYFEGKPTKVVAVEMGYCKRNVNYIRKTAVKIFQRVLDGES